MLIQIFAFSLDLDKYLFYYYEQSALSGSSSFSLFSSIIDYIFIIP